VVAESGAAKKILYNCFDRRRGWRRRRRGIRKQKARPILIPAATGAAESEALAQQIDILVDGAIIRR
jgi:hypothetical protein